MNAKELFRIAYHNARCTTCKHCKRHSPFENCEKCKENAGKVIDMPLVVSSVHRTSMNKFAAECLYTARHVKIETTLQVHKLAPLSLMPMSKSTAQMMCKNEYRLYGVLP